MEETPASIERKIDSVLLGVIAYVGRMIHTTWKLITNPGKVVEGEASGEYCSPVIYYLVTTFVCQFFMTMLSLTNTEAMNDPRFRGFFNFTLQNIKDNANHFDVYKLLLLLAPEVLLMMIFSIGASLKQRDRFDFKHAFSFIAYSFGAMSVLKAIVYFSATSVQGYNSLGVDFINHVLGWSLLLNVLAMITFFRITASYMGHAKSAWWAMFRGITCSMLAVAIMIVWAVPIMRWYQRG